MGTKGKNEFGEPIFDTTAYYVRKTNDYKKFKFADGNRNVERTGVLKRSIRENGWYRQPILVNDDYEIIEGQYRFVVCRSLQLPIEYIVQKGLKVSDCVPLNVGRKNWRINDYVHLGTAYRDDYRYFELLMHRFGFSPKVVYVATGKNISGNHIDRTIKMGNLECSVEEYNRASNVLEWLAQFKEDIKANDLRGRKDELFIALIFAYNSQQVNVAYLTERIHRNFSRYGRAIADTMDAIEKTEGIYNYKCKSENTIDLVSEYRQATRRERLNESDAQNSGSQTA